MPFPEGVPARHMLFIRGALFCENCLTEFLTGKLKLP
jgi:hypothetical protein